jgi:NADH:ubiquinone oxidoreductase subunit 3 (subunit A)
LSRKIANQKRSSRKILLVGLTTALVFVVLGVFVFSYAMETLDVKAEQLGAQEQPIYQAPFPDYNVAGSTNQWIALIVGIAATLLLFVAGLAVAKVISKKKRNQQ